MKIALPIRPFLKLLIPYKHLSYYREYIELCDSIVLYKNKRSISIVWLIITILLYVSVHYLYLYFWPLTELDLVVQGDLLYMSTGFRVSNIFAFPVAIMVMYFVYVLFVADHSELNSIVRGLLFYTNWANNLFIDSTYKQRPVDRLMRTIFLTTTNALQIFIIGLDFSLVFINCCNVTFLYKYRNEFFYSFCGYLNLLLNILNVALHSVGAILFANVLLLGATLGLNLLVFGNIRNKQNLLLLSRSMKVVNWNSLNAFIKHDIATMKVLAIINQTFSKLLLAFILFSLPTSVFSVMAILLGQVDHDFALLIVGMMAGHKLFGIFALHYFTAKLTAQIHRPSKMLMHIMVTNQHRIGQFRARVRLMHTIDRLHTRKRYGITYGGYGLVSMKSFVKCMLFYSEMLLTTYKLIKHID